MGKVLTVVAVRPDSTVLDDDSAQQEGDGPISAVMDALRARTDRTNHIVVRTATVERLAKLLKQHQGVERVQIIGHGRPGELLLGANWLELAGQPPSNGETYLLNSNPKWYGMLFDDL